MLNKGYCIVMLFDGLSEIEENDGKWWFQSQKMEYKFSKLVESY